MNDFGGKLRQARERRGVSLRQIAASTKISVGALEALERNDVSKLPGGIFSRAFVRSYASEVGLDPDETVREFLERFEGDAAASATTQAAPAAHRAVQAIRDAPARHVALPDDEGGFESQQRMAAVLFKLLIVSLPLVGIILYLTLGRGGAAAPDGSAGGATPGAQHDEAGAAAAGVRDEPSATPTTSSPAPQTPRASVEAAATSAAAVGIPADQPLVLELHPTGPCWISLTVDGQLVMSRLMQAGEKEVRRFRDTAVIDVGDAGAFAFSIDGRPGRPLGQSGQVRTARISRATLAEYLR